MNKFSQVLVFINQKSNIPTIMMDKTILDKIDKKKKKILIKVHYKFNYIFSMKIIGLKSQML